MEKDELMYFWNEVDNIISRSIENNAQSIFDNFIKENAKQRDKVGITSKIVRKLHGETCEWCRMLAGVYTYGEEPREVYMRHDNCDCTVEYFNIKGRQNVWKSNNDWITENNYHKKERIAYMMSNSKKELDVLKELREKTSGIAINGKNIYYNSPLALLKEQYYKGINDVWITSLFSLDDYILLHDRIERELVGKETVDGMKINSISQHFLHRMIGTLEDPKIKEERSLIIRRSGVELEDVEEALFKGNRKNNTLYSNGRRSISYIGKNCVVTLNPDTGRLLQCNLL